MPPSQMKKSLGAQASSLREHRQLQNGRPGQYFCGSPNDCQLTNVPETRRTNTDPLQPSSSFLQKSTLRHLSNTGPQLTTLGSIPGNFYDEAAVPANQSSIVDGYETTMNDLGAVSSQRSGTPMNFTSAENGSPNAAGTRLGQKGQIAEGLRCPYFTATTKPCLSVKKYNRDIIRHMFIHKFFFCPECCQRFNDRAQLEKHSCGRASICVYLECVNRGDSPQIHAHKEGCPPSFSKLDKESKWYAVRALALPGSQLPSWDYVCVGKGAIDESKPGINNAVMPKPESLRFGPAPPVSNDHSISRQLTSRTVLLDSKYSQNGMQTLQTMNTPANISPMQIGSQHNFQPGYMAFGHPQRQFDVPNWSQMPYPQQDVRAGVLRRSPALGEGTAEAWDLSDAPPSFAEEYCPSSGPYGMDRMDVDDCHEDIPFKLEDYTYSAFDPSLSPSGPASNRRF